MKIETRLARYQREVIFPNAHNATRPTVTTVEKIRMTRSGPTGLFSTFLSVNSAKMALGASLGTGNPGSSINQTATAVTRAVETDQVTVRAG